MAYPKKILPEAKADDNDLMNLKEEDFCDDKVVITSISSASKDGR